MKSFKIYLEKKEEEEFNNVNDLLSSLPLNHKKLLNGFEFIYTPNNTLKNDKNHIGYIHKKRIVVSAPWNYSRKFTTLHEIAHLVWEHLIKKDEKNKWKKIVKRTKNKQKQNPEELFCMAYACYYSKDHCPRIHDHKEWIEFIKGI